MALYEICFKHTETYYCYENIEADSQEQASKIASSLLDSVDFHERIMDGATCDDYEDEFVRAYTTRAAGGFTPRVTLTADEIASYIE